jgi:predicted outer membrane repeat protein
VQARVNGVHDWPGAAPCNALLQQCIDAAVVLPGDTIHIRPGVYTQSVTLAKSVSLVGDDSTTTVLQAPVGQRVLTVTGDLSFTTIISGLTFKGGDLSSVDCPIGCGGGILLSGNARPTLQNIALVANTAYQGGGMWVDGGTSLKLTNVSFISNTARDSGGGLYAMSDAQLINNDFERNVSTLSGGGVYAIGAVGLSGGRLVSNQANSGGGLYANALSLVDTEFSDNQASGGSGGGAYLNGQGQLTGGLFRYNSSQGFGDGGGLYAMGLNARGTVFISNTASSLSESGSGGGAYLSSNPSTLENVSFIGNTSVINGGGLYAGMPGLTLNDVSFIGNTTQGSGGGLQAQSAQVTGGVFDQNTSAGVGGGVAAFNDLALIGVRLTNNTSGGQGGGAYAGSTVWITNTFFIKNSALNGGGLYQTPAGDAHIVNALFARNQSTLNQAAAIAFAATGSFSMLHSTIVDNVLNPASAVAIDNANGAADIRDSIIASHAVGVELANGGTYEDYNLYFNNTTNITGPVTSGGNSFPNIDPQFVDPFSDDYHLRFTSPAINAGIDVGVNFDIDGQPRPIGPGFDIGFDEAPASIQEMIDSTPVGGAVLIPPGVYTESLTLYKPVSLVGAGIGRTIINALPNDRVLTVTGSTILPTTQIISLTLQGGRLGGPCQAYCNGGGVLIVEGAYPSFQSVMINDNQAVMGGGLYIQSGGAQLFNSSVVGNQATQSGGGAYVKATNATLEQFGGTFGGNLAIDGAGVFVQEGLFKQNGGVIYGNVASNLGGGMLIGSGGTIQTLAGQIISNSAQNAGGGVYVDVGRAELRDSLIANNVAYDGGGLYVRGDFITTTASVMGGKLENNMADAGGGHGGGVFARGTVLITGTRIFKNTAYDGSALEFMDGADGRLVNAFVADNPATGAFPSTNASVRFDSTGDLLVLHTTFGNATDVLTRALTVNSGVVTVANTIVASYTNGLSQFGGYLSEDYNLYFKTPITFTGSISNGGHSLIGPDPLFKNPLISDYHIKGLSPAVNQGANVGVRRDIDLDARPLGGGFDIGADEASVAGALPGPDTGDGFTYTTTQNSTISLHVPPGAVTQTTPIYCSLIQTETIQLPARLKFAGVLFELDAQLEPLNDSTPGSIDFNVPVTLTVSYTDQELADAGIKDESTMKLYRYETSIGEWKPIGYRLGETQTLDMDNNLITATVLGLSKFGRGAPEGGYEVFLPLILR